MSTEEFAAAFPFRVRQLEDNVRNLLTWRGIADIEQSKQSGRIASLEEKIDDLTHGVEALRKTVLGFAFSFAGSAVVFAFSVLIATGKI